MFLKTGVLSCSLGEPFASSHLAIPGGPRDAPIVDWDIVAAFSLDASRRAMATEGLLKIFFPQELSMVSGLQRGAEADRSSETLKRVFHKVGQLAMTSPNVMEVCLQ